ncbi:MAG TPA: SGNH/GDSL hydrolase family protein [Sphingomonas sp.]|uniref:SGNH/GDSL hydrolase family protein n=1 Tax=Sphingomonas sp. TaxID=28214 RepID=UPI002C792377|nr:SGNH/GDSL hydrolase family protein [Sphingomonas sp.]HMI20573.1 SGNH/GDSL hydrolase family protein [Sphingomonas sp.]
MKGWVLLGALALAQSAYAATPDHWIASWGAAQQIPEAGNLLPLADMQDATLRQIVHLTVGGSKLRVRFSNAFGTQALVIDDAHIARSADKASARIAPGTDRTLTFDGRPSIAIPPGAEYLSDPVSLAAPALSSLTVSIHLPQAPAGQTGHPGSRATSYYLHGDHAADADLPGAGHVDHWYQLTGVEVAAPPAAATIVAFGDSITDGHGATTNGDDRWPDILAARLQASPATHNLSVVNVGIGGNHLLTDGLGPNALARLDRDVFARPGAKAMLVLEAINDLGKLSREDVRTPEQHKQLVADLIAAYRQIILRAHGQGVRVIGCTVTPYVGSDYYHPDAASEADRIALNTWIRTSGAFDAIVDFDAAIRDPAHPERMIAAYDSGDHLHPSAAGYKVMAAAIKLEALR